MDTSKPEEVSHKRKKAILELDSKEPRFDLAKSFLQSLEWEGNTLALMRLKPVLLIYYHDDKYSQIDERDIGALEEKFGDNSFPELDLLIHTRGGQVSTSYSIAQFIRSRCRRLNTMIATHSYSGGTLISLASDAIEMSPTSKISPIDVQNYIIREDGTEEHQAPLDFDNYIQFISSSSSNFNFKDEKNRTEVICKLMEELCKKYDPIKIGELFRLRAIHVLYARTLLLEYLLKNDSQKDLRSEYIIDQLTIGSPEHNFEIDIKLARRMGIPIVDMGENIYTQSKKLISLCAEGTRNGIICKFAEGDERQRLPFIWIFWPSLNKTIDSNYDGNAKEYG
jgi:hypothetical protein